MSAQSHITAPLFSPAPHLARSCLHIPSHKSSPPITTHIHSHPLIHTPHPRLYASHIISSHIISSNTISSHTHRMPTIYSQCMLITAPLLPNSSPLLSSHPRSSLAPSPISSPHLSSPLLSSHLLPIASPPKLLPIFSHRPPLLPTPHLLSHHPPNHPLLSSPLLSSHHLPTYYHISLHNHII